MREIVFVGSSLDDLRDFPEQPRRDAGFALRSVQSATTPEGSKPLTGFTGAAVTELLLNN